jgi:hypothetical protein
MKVWLSLLLGLCLSGVVSIPHSEAKEVTGKVLAVYHEPITLNNKVFDKVSVTVHACSPSPTQLVTASYAPGSVSDDNSLGYLFNHQAIAARSSSSRNQFMNSVSGHITLLINDQTQLIEKTTFWGYNWECGRNIEKATTAPTGSTYQPPKGTAAPSTPSVPSIPSLPYIPGVPGIPSIPGIGRFGF